MDFDTYHQVVGGSFLDYIEYLNSIKPIQIEDFSLRKKEEQKLISFIEAEDFKEEPTIVLEILLFLLELLCDHYGKFCPSTNYLNMTIEEKLRELFSFYSSLGMNREDTLTMVKGYFKSLGKGESQ